MFPIKMDKLCTDRCLFDFGLFDSDLFDSDLKKHIHTKGKRMVRRITSKLDMGEDVSKYIFYANGLHNLFVQDLDKDMIKLKNNGLLHYPRRILQ